MEAPCIKDRWVCLLCARLSPLLLGEDEIERVIHLQDVSCPRLCSMGRSRTPCGAPPSFCATQLLHACPANAQVYNTVQHGEFRYTHRCGPEPVLGCMHIATAHPPQEVQHAEGVAIVRHKHVRCIACTAHCLVCSQSRATHLTFSRMPHHQKLHICNGRIYLISCLGWTGSAFELKCVDVQGYRELPGASERSSPRAMNSRILLIA